MNILVCVKQVPDDFAEIRLDPATGHPATAGAEKVANAFDTYALEMAARLCEAEGGEVTVAGMGPESAVSMMKNLLAVGAKKAYVFDTKGLENDDEAAVAAYLAAVVKKCEALSGESYDLILCGKESTDEISGQVGARLAEVLGRGFVSGVVDVQTEGGKLAARQETEEGYAKFTVDAPALFTVAKPAYDPRYPNIKAKMAARKATVPVISAEDAGIERCAAVAECVGYTEPAKRSAGVKIQEKEAADAVSKLMTILLQDKVL